MNRSNDPKLHVFASESKQVCVLAFILSHGVHVYADSLGFMWYQNYYWTVKIILWLCLVCAHDPQYKLNFTLMTVQIHLTNNCSFYKNSNCWSLIGLFTPNAWWGVCDLHLYCHLWLLAMIKWMSSTFDILKSMPVLL